MSYGFSLISRHRFGRSCSCLGNMTLLSGLLFGWWVNSYNIIKLHDMIKKSNQSIESAGQLFAQIKSLMTMRSSTKLKYHQLKNFSHGPMSDSSVGKIMSYIDNKTKFNKNMSNEECSHIMRALLAEDRGSAEKFTVESDGIVYVSRFGRITDEKGLLMEIENSPEGLLVDDELLRLSPPDVRNYMEKLIYNRQVIPAKGKNIEKSKIKENNYEGYILFAFPPEIKEIQASLFLPQIQQKQFDAQSKNLQDRDQKLKKLFKTKIQTYRKEFQNICSANINRGQSRGGQDQNTESQQKMVNSWNSINKTSVPNFDRQAEEWFKNRK